MKEQTQKMFRKLLIGNLVAFLLIIPELIISNLLANGNHETFKTYSTIFLVITLIIYSTYFIIAFIKYVKTEKISKTEKNKQVTQKLTTEFQKVSLNFSESIPEELFDCKAKIDSDGKIVCQIEINYQIKLDSYEKFLTHFNFNDNNPK